MFEEMRRELRRLQGAPVAVPDPIDADGYLDRECPDEKCLFGFKVHHEDWRDKVRDEEVFCPFCGHATPRAQLGDSRAGGEPQGSGVGTNSGAPRVSDEARRRAMESAPAAHSFIRMTMSVKDGSRMVTIPPAAVEPMRLKISCPACTCRYGVIGAAFFCPGCGHNAADQMFH